MSYYVNFTFHQIIFPLLSLIAAHCSSFFAGSWIDPQRPLGDKNTIEIKIDQCFGLVTTIQNTQRVADMCIHLQTVFETVSIEDYRIPNWEKNPLLDTYKSLDERLIAQQEKIKEYNKLMENDIFKTIALEYADQACKKNTLELNIVLDEILPNSVLKWNDTREQILSGNVTVKEAAKWSTLGEDFSTLFPANNPFKDRFSLVDNMLNNAELANQIIKLSEMYGLKLIDEKFNAFSVS